MGTEPKDYKRAGRTTPGGTALWGPLAALAALAGLVLLLKELQQFGDLR